jgi:hypothetical protein
MHHADRNAHDKWAAIKAEARAEIIRARAAESRRERLERRRSTDRPLLSALLYWAGTVAVFTALIYSI